MKLNYIDQIAYLVLFISLIVGVGSIFSLRYFPTSQFVVIVAFSFFYLIWASVFHLFKRDLNRMLFLEYLVISSIAIVVGYLVFIS